MFDIIIENDGIKHHNFGTIKNTSLDSKQSPMRQVTPKKKIGQHFLKDNTIAEKIADTLCYNDIDLIIEIGPGMGVLTQYLILKNKPLTAIEIDDESISYLNDHPLFQNQLTVVKGDFMKINLSKLGNNIAVMGNFPYYISTQIVFRVLEHRDIFRLFAGMFQKEVAERICASHGSKTYGILSVLTQVFYDVEYLFSVSEQVFDPPPKVKSGVMRMIRKEDYTLPCDVNLFFRVVKSAFNHRRKMLRNSLKTFELKDTLSQNEIFNKRPEQLNPSDFVHLTTLIQHQ